MRCGKHALNNALGGDHLFTDEDLERACDLLIWESMIPDDNGMLNPEVREDHVADDGWYSDQVMSKELQASRAYALKLTPLHVNVNDLEDPKVVGAIVNQRNQHWVALKRVGGDIWLLNSSAHSPRILPYEEYLRFVRQWRSCFPIERL